MRTFDPVYDNVQFELSFPRAARPYLIALQADAPPTWSCRACGHRPLDWRPRCPTCGTFDSLTWQPGAKRPSQVAGQVAVTPATPAPALAAPSLVKGENPASPSEAEPTLSPEEAARRTP